MTVNVSILHDGQKHQYALEENISIATFLKEKGLLAQTCGSAGKCGKCRIIANTSPCQEEKDKLNPGILEKGVRLACYTMAKEGLEIEILEQASLTVLTSYSQQKYEFLPLVEVVELSLPKPSIDDQRSDITRVITEAGCNNHVLNLKELSELSEKVHFSDSIHILKYNSTFLGSAKQSKHLAMAVDIGTTTIAATLIDLSDNTILSVIGEANAQAPFGADVISRINQTIAESTPNYKKNIELLQETVIKQITKMMRSLLVSANLFEEIQDVHYITIAGNTTMMHMFSGLPAKNISRAPFIPVTMDAMRVSAEELGMKSKAHVFLMPSIASYIGADIVAALLAVNAHNQEKPFLLLDLGTNAEIVLGYSNKFITCSAAAGPCFEGASLSCGLAGQDGAINKVFLSEDKKSFEYSTISDHIAKGICGSGVLDTLAMLLEVGAVDETGYLDADSSDLSEHILEDDNGQSYFRFSDNVVLTQKDIREVQLAKSAVRAGIHTLIQEAGLSVDDIENLYIAGGFGSAMDPKSAAKIGLIPQELLHCTHAIGNGASLGVIRYATEKNVSEHIEKIVQNTTYLELSALPSFTNLYVEHMIF